MSNLSVLNSNDLFDHSLQEIDKMQKQISTEIAQLATFNINEIDISQSDIDVYDFLFAAVFGLIGAAVSSNNLVKTKFDSIHTDASKNNPQTVLGNLLHHKGDAIDTINGKFIKRDGTNADLMFHRVLWGHDPLSLGKDNPFRLMINSHGMLKGITMAFQHLVADIFSKQGLPLPGHSFLDKVNFDGKLSNSFVEISKSLGNSRVEQQEIFSRMFTIRAQDILSQGFVWAACKGYFYYRGIEDTERRRQIKIISYSTNFFAHAGIGALRQGGIPYIHWPALTALVKEFSGMYLNSYKEIRRLESITESIIKENDAIEKKVFKTGVGLVTYTDSNDYINELVSHEKKVMDIIDFFEED